MQITLLTRMPQPVLCLIKKNWCFLSMTQIETGVVLGSLTLTEIKCAITYYGHWLIYAGSA